MIYFQSQVDRLMAEKDAQIAILKDELKRAQTEAEFERRRANNAVDQILNLQGSRGITPLPKRETEDLPKKILRSVAQVGADVEG